MVKYNKNHLQCIQIFIQFLMRQNNQFSNRYDHRYQYQGSKKQEEEELNRYLINPPKISFNMRERILNLNKQKAYKNLLDKQIEQKARYKSIQREKNNQKEALKNPVSTLKLNRDKNYPNLSYKQYSNSHDNRLRKQVEEFRERQRKQLNQIRKNIHLNLNSIKVEQYQDEPIKEPNKNNRQNDEYVYIVYSKEPIKKQKLSKDIEDIKLESYLNDCDKLVKLQKNKSEEIQFLNTRKPKYIMKEQEEQPQYLVQHQTKKQNPKHNRELRDPNKYYKYNSIINEQKIMKQREKQKNMLKRLNYEYKSIKNNYKLLKGNHLDNRHNKILKTQVYEKQQEDENLKTIDQFEKFTRQSRKIKNKLNQIQTTLKSQYSVQSLNRKKHKSQLQFQKSNISNTKILETQAKIKNAPETTDLTYPTKTTTIEVIQIDEFKTKQLFKKDNNFTEENSIQLTPEKNNQKYRQFDNSIIENLISAKKTGSKLFQKMKSYKFNRKTNLNNDQQ